MNGVAATRAVYAEQWLHEHGDELPDDIIEYIEQLRIDRDQKVDEGGMPRNRPTGTRYARESYPK